MSYENPFTECMTTVSQYLNQKKK